MHSWIFAIRDLIETKTSTSRLCNFRLLENLKSYVNVPKAVLLQNGVLYSLFSEVDYSNCPSIIYLETQTKEYWDFINH